MNFNKLNTLTGWVVFAFALTVYLMTMAPTASYWDCGEFIACSNELEVPHPPGAPFFLLVGRLFAMLAGDDVTMIPWMLNLFSALASAFTVLFTFWITTHLGEKLVRESGEPLQGTRLYLTLGAGVVAALANTFADSFWFNAVEAEVYALSSFFTAIVVWLMFKWEERADNPGNERWLILIAYLMGLSIGVHLLNLLTIPALAFIYYFRKYDFSWLGLIVTGLVAVAILGVVQTGIILNTFDVAWEFEKLFTGILYPNGSIKSGWGLPIGSGLIFFFALLFAALIAGLYITQKQRLLATNTALLATVMIYIGFSSYLMIPIRSQVNPPIDENDPENTQSFISYMKREQYGDRPLLYGPLYNAQPVDLKVTGKEYILEPDKNRYTELGDKRSYEYAPGDKKLFPRMYERGRYKMGPHAYVNYVRRTGDPNTPTDDKPTAAEDLKFFWGYQVVHMYWRYFMWNFAGREGDIQDQGWESGLNFTKVAKMPEFMKKAPAKNHYYMLPFLLGLIGLFWQSMRRGQDAAVVGLLFFFTGLAIVIYLNQYPAQPRERDYSFAGSFQTFAIWVGLGVIGIYGLLEKYLKNAAAIVALVAGFIPVILMGAQNWDDHDRSGRYVAPDSAYNLLNSVEKNGILFTNGDNDTFPLWYIQEVEGVRTDVRVLCLSYVNTDWYIDQMFEQVNESPPLPLSLTKDQYRGQKNQTVPMGTRQSIELTYKVDAQALLDQGIIGEEDLPYVVSPMSLKVNTRGGGSGRYLELKDRLILDLLENVAKDNWSRPVYFANTVTPSNFLGTNDYLRLEGLAYRIVPVKRPKVSDPYDPFDGYVDLARMDSNLMKVFKFTNLDKPGEYYDENILRMLGNYYNTFYRLSNAYLREAEKLEKENQDIQAAQIDPEALQVQIDQNKSEAERLRQRAIEVLDYANASFPYELITPDPYMIVRQGLMYDRLGEKEKADEMFEFGKKRGLETLKYYTETKDYFPKTREYAFPLNMLMNIYSQNGEREKVQELQTAMQGIDPKYLR